MSRSMRRIPDPFVVAGGRSRHTATIASAPHPAVEPSSPATTTVISVGCTRSQRMTAGRCCRDPRRADRRASRHPHDVHGFIGCGVRNRGADRRGLSGAPEVGWLAPPGLHLRRRPTPSRRLIKPLAAIDNASAPTARAASLTQVEAQREGADRAGEDVRFADELLDHSQVGETADELLHQQLHLEAGQ